MVTKANEPLAKSDGWVFGNDGNWDPIMHPGGVGYAYNNETDDQDASARWIDYSVPDGMQQGYLTHLAWSSCRFFRIFGVNSQNEEVFIRYVNAYQGEKNAGNSGNLDGTMAITIPGVNRFKKIRIRGSKGRTHIMGIGWTKEDYKGSETGLPGPTPNDAWQTSVDGNFREYHAKNARTYYGSQNGYEWRSAADKNIASIANEGHLSIAGGLAVNGDIVFNGGNNWIIHTPDDNRRTMYIAPSRAYGNGDWNWEAQTRFEADGTMFTRNQLVGSDARYKKNIKDLQQKDLANIDKLQAKSFSMKDDDENRKHYGFIAQEVEKVYPDLVRADVSSGYKSVNYNQVVPLAVGNIQELRKQVRGDSLCIGNTCLSERELAIFKNMVNK
jgi:hypothetical protein